ncbi:MAG: transporter substrate-binding domain-containing protein, partial [Luteimonas sp.]|nr:transporter substrate-binding domain-containing protein [Luteimonas sp.]
YLTRDGSAAGYSIAICGKVVENLRKVLNKPDLRVRYNNVTPMTRGLLVRERVVDIECGATSHTAGRAENFAFSLAFGVEKAVLISPAAAPVRELGQLSAGRKILVTEGSTSQDLLNARKQAGTLAAEIVPVRSPARAYYALKDKKADAYFGSPETFMGDMLYRGGNTAEFAVTPVPGIVEPLAIMMRRDRPGLKAVADKTLADLARSGELRTAYRAWFEQPIPGYGFNLALAPSPEWQAMLAEPHDRPAE